MFSWVGQYNYDRNFKFYTKVCLRVMFMCISYLSLVILFIMTYNISLVAIFVYNFINVTTSLEASQFTRSRVLMFLNTHIIHHVRIVTTHFIKQEGSVLVTSL